MESLDITTRYDPVDHLDSQGHAKVFHLLVIMLKYFTWGIYHVQWKGIRVLVQELKALRVGFSHRRVS